MIRIVHCKRTPFTHYIGRNAEEYGFKDCDAKLGNPHHIDGKRWDTIKAFEAYARATPEIMARIKALPRDAVLGCWCWPNACHGDVIARMWEEMHPRGCVEPVAS